jgi:hypothetical protein
MQELQQRFRICIKLFEGLAFEARNKPCRLAHLDHGDWRGIC